VDEDTKAGFDDSAVWRTSGLASRRVLGCLGVHVIRASNSWSCQEI